PEVVEAPGVRDEVQALGRSANEDDLPRGRSVDEPRHLVPRALVLLRRALGQRVDAPVHVRVRGLVEGAQLVQDLARLVRGHRRVEIRERPPVNLLLEDREVGAQHARAELRLLGHGHETYRTGGAWIY